MFISTSNPNIFWVESNICFRFSGFDFIKLFLLKKSRITDVLRLLHTIFLLAVFVMFFFSKVLYLLGRSHEKRYFFAMLYFSFNSAPKWEPKMKCFMAYSYLKVCDKI